MRLQSSWISLRFRSAYRFCCVMAVLLAASACQAISQTTPSDVTTPAESTSFTSESKATTSETTAGTQSTADTSPAEPEPFSEADLVITVQGQDYSLLEDAAGLLQALGDDCQFSEAESCVYDGMDKTFDYGSIFVYTVPSGTADLLDGLDVYDDSITTARGIRVGADRNDVLLAYGPQAGQESDLVYNVSGNISRLGDPKLTFIMDGDQIAGISYYSGSNFQD